MLQGIHIYCFGQKAYRGVVNIVNMEADRLLPTVMNKRSKYTEVLQTLYSGDDRNGSPIVSLISVILVLRNKIQSTLNFSIFLCEPQERSIDQVFSRHCRPSSA